MGAKKFVLTLLMDLIRVERGALRRHANASVPFEGHEAALVTLSRYGILRSLLRIHNGNCVDILKIPSISASKGSVYKPIDWAIALLNGGFRTPPYAVT